MKLHTGHRTLSRKILVLSTAVVAAVSIVWAGAGLYFYLAPASSNPKHADAVLVLAPAQGRLEYAEQLMEQGLASTLVISVPPPEYRSSAFIPCDAERTYRIICFEPDPVTTQGEARALRRLANDNGWKSVSVVTDKSHALRANLLISRCYEGDIEMIPLQKNLPLLPLYANSWAFAYTYESAAFAKALQRKYC